MNKVLHHSVRLECNAHSAFEMFTVNSLLEEWLPKEALVEPVVGGKYELFWEPEDVEKNSTIGCKVTAVEQDKLIAFEWKGPIQFRHFMNDADPLTHISVFFLPCEGEPSRFTEVHLIHSGWRNSKEWEDARLFFSRSWQKALEDLRKYISGRDG